MLSKETRVETRILESFPVVQRLVDPYRQGLCSRVTEAAVVGLRPRGRDFREGSRHACLDYMYNIVSNTNSEGLA